jgi:hypothetical protein
MTAAKKLNHTQSFTPVLVPSGPDLFDLSEALAVLGWNNLPIEIHTRIKDDLLQFMRELNGKYATTDAKILKRRRRLTFWINSYIQGDCSLNTLLEMIA